MLECSLRNPQVSQTVCDNRENKLINTSRFGIIWRHLQTAKIIYYDKGRAKIINCYKLTAACFAVYLDSIIALSTNVMNLIFKNKTISRSIDSGISCADNIWRALFKLVCFVSMWFTERFMSYSISMSSCRRVGRALMLLRYAFDDLFGCFTFIIEYVGRFTVKQLCQTDFLIFRKLCSSSNNTRKPPVRKPLIKEGRFAKLKKLPAYACPS